MTPNLEGWSPEHTPYTGLCWRLTYRSPTLGWVIGWCFVRLVSDVGRRILDMPRQLPDNWQTLNVARDLGLKGVPQDLRLKKVPRTKNLVAQFLPPAEDDPRPNSGRSKGGKRLAISASMGTDDPWEAGKRAITWVQEKQRENRQAISNSQINKDFLLEKYWEQWFAREGGKIRRNPGKWRERKLLWEAEAYGIKHQPWAGKPLDEITAGDMEDYWAFLDNRKDMSKG